jgi:hypothetical protein
MTTSLNLWVNGEVVNIVIRDDDLPLDVLRIDLC